MEFKNIKENLLFACIFLTILLIMLALTIHAVDVYEGVFP